MTTAYLAAEGLQAQLQEELRRADVIIASTHGRLLLTEAPAIRSAWAANIWHDCIEWPVESIGSAAKALRGLQRNWAMYAPVYHRRAALIQ
jgi:23S rRNA (cytidine2498-2'-O)-methyltransferase